MLELLAVALSVALCGLFVVAATALLVATVVRYTLALAATVALWALAVTEDLCAQADLAAELRALRDEG